MRNVAYFGFDLLYLDGEDLRGAPLAERKRRLARLLDSGKGHGTSCIFREPLRLRRPDWHGLQPSDGSFVVEEAARARGRDETI
jgi:ATP-dependent DNA ligase